MLKDRNNVEDITELVQDCVVENVFYTNLITTSGLGSELERDLVGAGVD